MPRVLIVDDDQGILDVFSQRLKQCCEVVCVRSVERATEELQKGGFDVIALDGCTLNEEADTFPDGGANTLELPAIARMHGHTGHIIAMSGSPSILREQLDNGCTLDRKKRWVPEVIESLLSR